METIKRCSRGELVKLLQQKLNLYPDGIFGALTEEAVKEFQKSYGLVDDGIVGAKTWNVLLGGDTQLMNSRRSISKIIVHCTATEEGKDYTVDDIRRWHLAQGWADIGYHYIVYRDGSVHTGRNVNLVGAHCKGQNTGSIGVVYIGGIDKFGKPKDTRTDKQKEALRLLIKRLKDFYPNAKVYGHRDFANKACPSFDAKNEYKEV